MVYENAFEITGKLSKDKIGEAEFNRLQIDYAKRYLASIRFDERLSLHRNPAIVIQETLNELYPYFQTIQQRKELLDIDPAKKTLGNAVSKVADLWRENKYLKSLYNSVLAYCKLRDKEPNVIAPHIAEYKSLLRLSRLLEIRVRKEKMKVIPISGNLFNKQEPPSITIHDRLMRELDIIYNIFLAQFEKANLSIPFPYPEILDANGINRVDGIYYNWIDVFSEHELFPVQYYKQTFTTRYESTSNPDLLRNQLGKIYEKAKSAREFYTTKLTSVQHIDTVVADFLSINEVSGFNEQQKLLESHNAVVTVGNYQINIIYQGTNRHRIGDFIDRSKYPYNYIINNYELDRICQHVLDFIELFNLPLKKKETIKKGLTKNETPYLSLQEVFVNNEIYEKTIKALIQFNGINESHKNIAGPRLKGMIQVMISLLRANNSLKYVTDKELTVLLNSAFNGLNLSESTEGRTLRNVNKKATDKYKKKIQDLLA